MPEKILVVDDDPAFRGLIKKCLPEYQVLEAADGVEALDLLRNAHDITIAILDVRMPRLNGIDALKEIKKEDPALCIIIVTGYGDKDTVIDALKGHADDYLEKPVDPEKVRALIEKNLKRKKAFGAINAAGIDGKIEQVKRFVERNCFKKTGLDDAAKNVGLSPKYLSRIFKERTGESYVKYRIKIKNEAAQKLLKQGDLNVSQIASKLGYDIAGVFSRQFKHCTGQTPTKYRKGVSGR